GLSEGIALFSQASVFPFQFPDLLSLVQRGWRGCFVGSCGAVFFHPVRQRGAVDPKIGGDGLDRGACGVLIQGYGVALELLCVGLDRYGGRLPFPASCWF